MAVCYLMKHSLPLEPAIMMIIVLEAWCDVWCVMWCVMWCVECWEEVWCIQDFKHDGSSRGGFGGGVEDCDIGSVATVQFHPVQRGVFMNAELDPWWVRFSQIIEHRTKHCWMHSRCSVQVHRQFEPELNIQKISFITFSHWRSFSASGKTCHVILTHNQQSLSPKSALTMHEPSI